MGAAAVDEWHLGYLADLKAVCEAGGIPGFAYDFEVPRRKHLVSDGPASGEKHMSVTLGKCENEYES